MMTAIAFAWLGLVLVLFAYILYRFPFVRNVCGIWAFGISVVLALWWVVILTSWSVVTVLNVLRGGW